MAFIPTSHVFEVQAKFIYNLSLLLFVPENIDSHLIDESSLASTNQMREFLVRLGPNNNNDRVLLIGDIRQNKGSKRAARSSNSRKPECARPS
jgi:ribosomal protein L4